MRWTNLGICILICMSCVPKKEAKNAMQATAAEDWGKAYQLWSEVLDSRPGDTRAKLERERARLNASLHHLQRAARFFEAEKTPEAVFELNLTLSYDPDNQEAKRLLKRLAAKQRDAQLAEDQKEAKKREEAATRMPLLNPITWGPQDLRFIKKSVRDIYMSMGRAYGINVVVDSKIRDDKITMDLRNLSFLKALDTLMVLNRHFFHIVDHNTLIILEDNKTNRDNYDNQIIRTFYLSNITPKDLKAHLRQLGGIKEFAENETLNAITIKGTPEQIGLAERIISANDKARPEVVVEIELLEINKNKMRRLGILPVGSDGSPRFQAGVIADPVGRSDDDENLGGIRGVFPDLNSNDFLTIVPALAIDFLKEHGDSKQVANPHLRVTSGESGLVRIGQNIPIASTSFTNPQISGSTSGSNNFGDQALTTFNYTEIGIKIDVTPRVHYNDEITLDLELEISSVLTAGFQPILGQRQVNTSIRLKNGEMNVLAGLLTTEERQSLRGIAGLSDIPILGKLFTNDEKIATQTDIIMTIRPIIIRGADITEEDRAPYELSSLRLSSLYSKDALQPSTNQPKSTKPVEPADDYTDEEPAEEPEDAAYEDGGEGDEELAPEGPAPALLAFNPNYAAVRQDELMEISVFITNVAQLRRGEIALNFDPLLLQVEKVDIGDLFNASGQRPHVTPAWDNNLGTVGLIVTQRFGADPYSGSGILANVVFRAKAPGSGELKFRRIQLTNPENESLPVEGLPAEYEVSP